MKKNLVILLISFSLTTTAQVRLENMILKNSGAKELYKGLDNKLRIVSEDSQSVFTLKAKLSDVNPLPQKNYFQVRSNSLGKDTLQIFKNNKLVKQTPYDIKLVPDPLPFVYKRGRNLLSIAQIEASPYLRCWPFECNLDFGFEVVSFSLTVVDKLGNLVIAASPNYGNRISKQNLFFIMQQKRGAKLYFEDIKVGLNRTGDIRRMNGITIKII